MRAYSFIIALKSKPGSIIPRKYSPAKPGSFGRTTRRSPSPHGCEERAAGRFPDFAGATAHPDAALGVVDDHLAAVAGERPQVDRAVGAHQLGPARWRDRHAERPAAETLGLEGPAEARELGRCEPEVLVLRLGGDGRDRILEDHGGGHAPHIAPAASPLLGL